MFLYIFGFSLSLMFYIRLVHGKVSYYKSMTRVSPINFSRHSNPNVNISPYP